MTTKYELLEIPMASIKPSKDNPRRTFNEDKLKELAESIKNVDLLEEISVRSTDNGDYEIINGERRYRAEKSIGATTLRAKVYHVDALTAQEMRLTELSQTENVEQVEVENAVYRYWIAKDKPQYKELVAETGFSEKVIGEYVRAGKERFPDENTSRVSEEVLNVSASDLQQLRPIKTKFPNVYKALLKSRADDMLTSEQLRKWVKDTLEANEDSVEAVKEHRHRKKTGQPEPEPEQEAEEPEPEESTDVEIVDTGPTTASTEELDRMENERAITESIFNANTKVATTVKWKLVKDITDGALLNKCIDYVAAMHRTTGNFLREAGFEEVVQ
jgi:ParB/RepB/Spo0J family partition protein